MCIMVVTCSYFSTKLVSVNDLLGDVLDMAAASRYRKFLKLCEMWPVDASKTDRDLGLYIRRRIADGFHQGDATMIDVAECDRIYNSLYRIASNHFRRSYPRLRDSTFSGLNMEDCRTMNSTEGLEILRSNKFKFWKTK